MNVLGFIKVEDNGFAVEITIDEIPVSQIFSENEMPIAGAYFQDDFPNFPPGAIYTERKLIAVCVCGEYGCGNINCHVKSNGETIVWSDFKGRTKKSNNTVYYEFQKRNYISVIKEIEKLTKDYFKTNRHVGEE